MSNYRGEAPAAPTRARRLTTRTPLSSSTNVKNKSTTSTDQLADDLTTLTIASTSTSTIKKVTSKVSTSTPTTSSLLRRRQPVASTSTLPDLTKKSELPWNNIQSTPSERAREAMKGINSSLNTLSTINKSGWRALANSETTSTITSTITTNPSTSSRPPSLKAKSSSSSLTSISSGSKENLIKIEAAVDCCSAALEELRKLIREKKINNKAVDIEKAAGSLIANLVEMESYELALPQLTLMRSSILSLFSNSSRLSIPPNSSILSYTPILSLPLPADSCSGIPSILEIVPLVLAVQQYTLGCLFRSELIGKDIGKRSELVAKALESTGNALEWRKKFEEAITNRNPSTGSEVDVKVEADLELVRKRVDNMMTSMFGTLTKGCVGIDLVAPMESLLSLRSRALLYYSSTRTLYADVSKLDAFYEQTRKVLLLYGRRAEEMKVGELQLNEQVKKTFKEVVAVLDEKKVKKQGKAWVTLCEVVLHIAKRADDLAMVEQASSWIGIEITAVDPETQVSQICARVVRATAVIEAFWKSGEDKEVLNQFITIKNSIPLLTSLRAQELPIESHAKIDKVLGRLQYGIVKRIKGTKRVDQLMTGAGEEKVAQGELDLIMFELLNAFIIHAETLLLEPLVADAIQSLLTFAYLNFSIDDRSTYSTTFNFLNRCLPLLNFSPESISLVHHFSICRLASAYYNIGGTLFNIGRTSESIRFTKNACDITLAAVKTFANIETEAEGEMKQSMTDLKKYLPKRWELLALAQHAIGEKKCAYESYVSAIVHQPIEIWEELESLAATTPISSLLLRFTPLHRLTSRATKIATFELDRKATSYTCLRSKLQEIESISSSVIGSILELQMSCLDSNLDKPEALSMLENVLEDVLVIYNSSNYPIRRSRVLLQTMQLRCVTSSVRVELSLSDTATEIEALLSLESFGNDINLRQFAPQYLSFSHIWLGFYAHRQQSSSTTGPTFNACETTSVEARLALRILRDSLDSDIPASPSTSKRINPPTPISKIITPIIKSTRRVTRVVTKAAFKTPMISRTRPGGARIVNLVTPPSRGGVDLTNRSTSSPKKTDIANILLDDPEKCYSLLDTMANLLGALGFSLLRISYLKFLRRLGSKSKSPHDGAFVTASAYLGREYLRLGKTLRAGLVFAQAETRLLDTSKPTSSIPPEAQILFYTQYAEYLSVLGSQDRSVQAYEDARKLLQAIDLPTNTSSTAAIIERTLLLQRSAIASGVCSVILQRKGDLSSSLAPAMQALRVWLRALRNISRLTLLPTDTPTINTTSVFTSTIADKNAPLPDHPSTTTNQSIAHLGAPNSALAWQIAESLMTAMLRVATIYLIRGTPKSADHYTQQAVTFAEEMGSTRLLARAIAVRAEVRLQSHNFVDAKLDLDRMEELLGSSSCPEAIDAQRLRADLLLRESSAFEAHQSYIAAQKSLDSFVQAAAEGEAEMSPSKALAALSLSTSRTPPSLLSPSPRQNNSASDAILPATLAHILRMRVGLLRSEDKKDESTSVLRRLARITSSAEDKAEELRLLATIQLEDLLYKFHSDPVLDTVLSIPVLGVVAVKSNAPMSNPPLITTSTLKDIETLLARAIALSVSRVEPSKLRELSVVTASLRALQATVGKSSKRSAADVACVLDLGVAVALRREMLHAIESKLENNALHDDMKWPSIETTISSEAHEDPTTAYWISVRERYRTESAEPIMTDPSFSTLLPTGWTIASLHLTAEKDCLLLVRHRRSEEPLVFKMPLDRQARRENEDETLSYATAIGELTDIIAKSNTGTQRAKHVDGKAERVTWWKERVELDTRLKDLTEAMEETWLGAFKSLLLAPRPVSSESLTTFGTKVEAVLRRSIVRSQTTKAARFKFDNGVLSSLSALPPDAKDEDLEDLFYYMTESLQLPSDETDVDQVVCDLRTALEALHADNPVLPPSQDEHTFLILDKSLQAFPWESIPCLRGRSVSRLPALSFLRDRIDLASLLSESKSTTCEIVVNPAKTSYVLNPSGDLKKTQAVFEPWLKEKKAVGWSGIIGRAPSDEEMKVALSTRDLFLYFGHGGAEQYVRSQTIRNLTRCAVTMLWGCSSGMLKDVGDHDPTGTPYHYLIAGCPALVANLWDVTDKDIDKFSETVFEKLGLKLPEVEILNSSSTDEDESKSITLASAIGESRDVCNLRYLNGAAPVVYGVPVRFLK